MLITIIDLRMEFKREIGDYPNNNSEYIKWLEQRALKEMRERWITEKFTCSKCDTETNGCEFAFDGYNTNGDCLAVK